MKDFERWVEQARTDGEKGGLAIMAWTTLMALEALAAERAAERERQATQWTRAEISRLPPFIKPEPAGVEPVSVGHWGMVG